MRNEQTLTSLTDWLCFKRCIRHSCILHKYRSYKMSPETCQNTNFLDSYKSVDTKRKRNLIRNEQSRNNKNTKIYVNRISFHISFSSVHHHRWCRRCHHIIIIVNKIYRHVLAYIFDHNDNVPYTTAIVESNRHREHRYEEITFSS